MTAVELSKMPASIDPLETATAEMSPGEKLIWAETAISKNVRRRMIPISLLGWVFLVLSFAWIDKAASTSIGLLLFGLPFVIGSLAIATLPWWRPVYAKRTIYAISDQRLLIIRNLMKYKVTSYGPEDIDVVERRENRDGSGDLIFRREEIKKLGHHHDPSGKRRVGQREVGFFGVPDVRRVEVAVRALKQKSSQVDIGHAQGDDDVPSAVVSSTPPKGVP